MTNTVFQGTVKWFNYQKGYGFIVPSTGGSDVFVHVSGLNGVVLKEGQKVSYELTADRKGRTTATNIIVQR